MLEGIHWWEGAAGALLGAFIGSYIPLRWARSQRRTERLGELLGMRSEMQQAQVCIEALLNDGVPAPLYHLPLSVFRVALPKLIGDGLLRPFEVSALVEYLNGADELNRGLDRAGEAAMIEGQSNSLTRPMAADLLTAEFKRNKLKAENLRSKPLERLNGGPVLACAWNALVRVEIAQRETWLEFLCGTFPFRR
jgi:hypothetical protein